MAFKRKVASLVRRMDRYVVAILSMVLLAALLPIGGGAAIAAGWITDFAIALLFFLYGARLPQETVVEGLTHWRLQAVVLAATFILFPLLGLLAGFLARPVLGGPLALGLLFLCLLPSTVQSSIAFTSVARGNVAAALCSASISNLLGVALTPLLVGLLVETPGGGLSLDVLRDIAIQLLAPFLAGQALRPWLKGYVARWRSLLGYVDRAVILLVVYTAFSHGAADGVWRQVTMTDLVLLLAIEALLLAVVLGLTTLISRRLGFSREDEIAIVFCGSKKSLASGIPIANVLFPAQSVGLIVLPVMLFHQMQLMACAAIAQGYAQRGAVTDPRQARGS